MSSSNNLCCLRGENKFRLAAKVNIKRAFGLLFFLAATRCDKTLFLSACITLGKRSILLQPGCGFCASFRDYVTGGYIAITSVLPVLAIFSVGSHTRLGNLEEDHANSNRRLKMSSTGAFAMLTANIIFGRFDSTELAFSLSGGFECFDEETIRRQLQRF